MKNLILTIMTSCLLLGSLSAFADAPVCKMHPTTVQINNQSNKAMKITYEIIPYMVDSNGMLLTLDRAGAKTYTDTIDRKGNITVPVTTTNDQDCYANERPGTLTPIQMVNVVNAVTTDNKHVLRSGGKLNCSVRGTSNNKLFAYVDLLTPPQHKTIACIAPLKD